MPFDNYLGRTAYTQELTSEFGQEAEKELTEIRRVRKEIEKIQSVVLDAATAAGNVASNAHSVSFDGQADEHQLSAQNWLRALKWFAAASLAIVLLVVFEVIREIRDDSFVTSVETAILKVAILAFLYIGIRFTIRNYSAHQHLYIVNKHRANVLKTMDAFRTSALDDPAKDSILLAAVGVAYSPQETGFITTKEGAGSEDGDFMTHIMKTASGK